MSWSRSTRRSATSEVELGALIAATTGQPHDEIDDGALASLLSALDPRERRVLTLRFGLDGGEPETQIETARRLSVRAQRGPPARGLRAAQAAHGARGRLPCRGVAARCPCAVGVHARPASRRRGCPHAGDDRSKRVVQRYYEDVLAGRRLDVLERLVAPGFVGHDPAGATMDRAGYFDAVRLLHDAFGEIVVSIDDQVAERDRVTTRWSAVGTHIGEFAGIPPTGRNVILAGIDIHRLDGDRLVELWEQLDLATIISQLM